MGAEESRRVTSTAAIANITPDESIVACAMCLGDQACRGWTWCRRCLLDFRAGLHRRRAASYRLMPLDCGRRDPLDTRRAA